MFLFVAQHPGALRREIERETGLSQASINRHLHLLGKGVIERTGKDGLNLIFTDADPLDPRAHRAYLTTRGTQVVREIASIMEDK